MSNELKKGKNISEMDSADVAKELRNGDAKIVTTEAREQEKTFPSSVSSKSEEKSDMVTTTTKNIPNESTSKISQRRVKREERAKDLVAIYLDAYKESPIGSAEKVEALRRIVTIIYNYQRKDVLDTVLAFFVANQKEKFLNEMNALQGIESYSSEDNMRARLIYSVFYGIAQRRLKSINYDTLRTVFRSDDFVNWIASQLRRR